MILSFLLGIFFTVANAQTDESILNAIPDVIQEQVDISLDPQVPPPNSPVTITLGSYGNNLDAASIKWSLNGKVIQTGTGDKVLKMTTGNAGEISKIVVSLIPNDGPPFSQTVTIVPENLDLLWQSDGYVPPFYQGKALYPSQGKITFLAMPDFIAPDGTSIPAKNLIYKWTKDNTVLGSLSGYGQNTLDLTGEAIMGSVQVQVDVQNQDGSLHASKVIEVGPSDTEALIYQTNSLLGVLFNKAVLADFNLNGKEGTFEAYPYFFSTNTRNNPSLSYNWGMNNSSINVPSTQDNMTFRNDNGSTGNSIVSVNISTVGKILQSASKSFNLNFGQSSKNFFNF